MPPMLLPWTRGRRPPDYDLQVICLQCHTAVVDVRWPREFGRWPEAHRKAADAGDRRARRIYVLTLRALRQLERLPAAPSPKDETATLKRVRQSKRYQLWRVSHAYEEGVAVRLICWFPPEADTVVVTLFAGDKATIGDVFYNSVANRADPLIDQWRREKEQEAES
jgi:hypothetical protein